MNALTVIMLIFSVIGALDRILGNHFGLGKEFEKGFMLLGNMALSMVGMLVIAPVIAHLLEPVLEGVYRTTGMDPSVIPAALFANDMGGASLSVAVAREETMGLFQGLVVTSMMGCTISYTVPYSLGVVDKSKHKNLFLGILCGLVTVPLGCLVGGVMMKISLPVLLWNLLPLLAFSLLVVLGLLYLPDITVKIFSWLGVAMRALITVGLVLGMLEYITGKQIVEGLAGMDEAAMICVNSAIILSGAFPLMNLVSRLCAKPLRFLGGRLGINEKATLGLLSSMVSSTTTFGMMDEMDDKGIVINSAFAVSAAFVLGAHLAFTMAFAPGVILPVIVSKLLAGFTAPILAIYVYNRMQNRKGKEKRDLSVVEQ